MYCTWKLKKTISENYCYYVMRILNINDRSRAHLESITFKVPPFDYVNKNVLSVKLSNFKCLMLHDPAVIIKKYYLISY